MIEAILIGVLSVFVVFNFIYTYAVMTYVLRLHQMLDGVFVAISNKFMIIENELKSAIKLKPGEKLMPTTLCFKGIDIAKASGEPMESITVLEYTNAPSVARVDE